MEQIIKKCLVNYTDEIIIELIENVSFDSRNIHHVRKQIMSYLRKKYNFSGCPTRGQKNYWRIRGFNEQDSLEKSSTFSKEWYSTNSIQSIMKRHNVSKDEAALILKERSNKGLKTLKDNHTEEEMMLLNKKKASKSLSNLQRIYGDKEGASIYNARKEASKYNCSLEGFVLRYGEKEGKAKYLSFCEGSKKQNTLLGYIERYGEKEGKAKWDETRKKKSVAHTLKGYIERYGEKTGRKRYQERQERYTNTFSSKSKEELREINSKKRFSYDKAVIKYGKDVADQMMLNRQHKFKASKESLTIFIPLYKILRTRYNIRREDIHFGISGSKEYYINEKDGKFYSYDFTIKSKKIIIEYNGSLFHPKCNDPEWKQLYSNKSADEVLKYDQAKKHAAEQQGFTYITIWDTKTPKENLEIIIEQYEKTINNI